MAETSACVVVRSSCSRRWRFEGGGTVVDIVSGVGREGRGGRREEGRLGRGKEEEEEEGGEGTSKRRRVEKEVSRKKGPGRSGQEEEETRKRSGKKRPGRRDQEVEARKRGRGTVVEEEMTRGRRGQPVRWVRQYDVAVEAHPAHGYYVVGRRRGSKTVGERLSTIKPHSLQTRTFFFTPRFCPTRVQQLHLSHGGDAPALMI